MAKLHAFTAVLAGILVIGAGSADAASVRATNIANGQEFGFSPFFFQVEYGQAVQVGEVRLTNVTERADVPMDFTPRPARSRAHSIPLPSLAPHRYRLSWQIIDASGRRVPASVDFSIKGCEVEGSQGQAR